MPAPSVGPEGCIADWVGRSLTETAGDPGDAAWGFVFYETDPDNYWVFQINALGWYSVEQVIGGEHDLIVPWSQSEEIRSEGVNVLKIRIDETREGHFWINDTEITPIDFDSRPEYGGSFGLLLRSGQEPEVEIIFDNLEVNVLDGK